MKNYLILLSLFILSGCSVFQPLQSTMVEPKLLRHTPLPSLPESADNITEVYCEFLITEKGTVEDAKVLIGSGDETWDYMVQLSLLNWEFSPALLDGKPIEILIKRKLNIQYSEQETISLAEIQLSSLADAQSAYSALLSGDDFSQLALKYSVAPSKEKGGKLGKVNIKCYVSEIRSVISGLKENEFSRPIPYGEHYAIFKRLKDNNGL
jgi:hypothetical protein